MLLDINNSIQLYSLVCTQLNGSKYCHVLLTIQLMISHLFTDLLTNLLTCTCIDFHPGRVEPAPSRVKLLIEEDTLEFDWGKGPKSYPEERPICRRFLQTHWQSDPRPPAAGTDTSWIFTRSPLAGLRP